MALPVPKLLQGKVACSDVVKCVFDLKEQDLRVYETLNDLGPVRAEEVGRALGKDASVAYRNLQKLVGCGLVEKRQNHLDGGGHFFLYEAVPREVVKARLTGCVDDWYAQMTAAIDRL